MLQRDAANNFPAANKHSSGSVIYEFAVLVFPVMACGARGVNFFYEKTESTHSDFRLCRHHLFHPPLCPYNIFNAAEQSIGCEGNGIYTLLHEELRELREIAGRLPA